MKNVYCVRDSKMEYFATPVLIENDAIAMRQFGDVILKGGDTVMGQHPADFSLYAVATFDSTTGKFENLECARLLAVGSDFVNSKE